MKVATSRIGMHSDSTTTTGDITHLGGFNGTCFLAGSLVNSKKYGSETSCPKMGMLLCADRWSSYTDKTESEEGDLENYVPLPTSEWKDRNKWNRRSMHINEKIYETTRENTTCVFKHVGKTYGTGVCHRFLTEDKAACPVDKDCY